MNQHAEYVSPGHPDRLADAIAESIVTAAVRQKPDALVGVEVAVHTDCVFVDGRIAAGLAARRYREDRPRCLPCCRLRWLMESGPRENPCDDRPLPGGVVARGIRHPAVLR